jgi:hypothetical protein
MRSVTEASAGSCVRIANFSYPDHFTGRANPTERDANGHHHSTKNFDIAAGQEQSKAVEKKNELG